MKDLERRIGSIARSGLPVLIEGASGTGKEALAELLHKTNGVESQFTRVLCRKTAPVVYPATPMFNGGVDLGVLYPQTRGTVFLKNVHLLCPAEQEQLLAALIQVTDPRDEKDQAAAARLVSSATESLEPFVSRGDFNPALYHRLSVYRIWLPPLRERREDILPMARLFLKRFADESNRELLDFTPEAIELLSSYKWPGNVRQLQNAVQHAVLMCENGIVQARDLGLLVDETRQLEEGSLTLIEQMERSKIIELLAETQGNKLDAARRLGIGRQTLYNKIKTYEIAAYSPARTKTPSILVGV